MKHEEWKKMEEIRKEQERLQRAQYDKQYREKAAFMAGAQVGLLPTTTPPSTTSDQPETPGILPAADQLLSARAFLQRICNAWDNIDIDDVYAEGWEPELLMEHLIREVKDGYGF